MTLRLRIPFLARAAALLLGSALAAQTLALRPARILDPGSGTVLESATVLVEAGRIKAIGKNLPLPVGAKVIELPNQTLVPGYIDCHTHLCATLQPRWDGEDFYFMALNHPTALRALEGAAHARQMLEAGFTTVRDAGNGGDHADLELARALAWKLVPGPTMLASGRILTPFGGQFMARADAARLEHPEYAFADSHDAMRKAIRENIYYGAHLIKVVADAKPYHYTEEDLRFIREEAGRAGRRVAVHCGTLEAARAAAAAGVASIEHGWNLDDATMALMKRNGVVLVSTDFTVAALREAGADEARAKKLHQCYVARLKRAFQAGVTVAFGTDLMGEGDRGRMALDYVDSFLEAGLPALAILKAMTVNGAKLLGVEQKRGLLQAGLAADFIALEGNPLQDPQTLKRVRFVMQDGRVVRAQ